jgi:hypothetical protein
MRARLLSRFASAFTLQCCIRAQPKRDVRRLPGLLHYPYEIIVQRLKICLVA